VEARVSCADVALGLFYALGPALGFWLINELAVRGNG
jgi:hypothetical protein